MIVGIVTPLRQVIIHLQVRGHDGREEDVEAIVDTGFNGFLTLPSEIITRLGLTSEITAWATLGNGSEVELQVYGATALWNQTERNVTVRTYA